MTPKTETTPHNKSFPLNGVSLSDLKKNAKCATAFTIKKTRTITFINSTIARKFEFPNPQALTESTLSQTYSTRPLVRSRGTNSMFPRQRNEKNTKHINI